jgi:hypothetical protein
VTSSASPLASEIQTHTQSHTWARKRSSLLTSEAREWRRIFRSQWRFSWLMTRGLIDNPKRYDPCDWPSIQNLGYSPISTCPPYNILPLAAQLPERHSRRNSWRTPPLQPRASARSRRTVRDLSVGGASFVRTWAPKWGFPKFLDVAFFLCGGRGEPVARQELYPPSARRLRALIEVLGFEGRGAQTRFAKEIGVDRRRLNNVLVGHPLSRQLAGKIIRRYPGVSADFLFLGESGGHLDRKLEKQLLDYQQRTGISVFDS